MKNIVFILLITLVTVSCNCQNDKKNTSSEVEKVAVAYQSFGDKINDENVITKEALKEKYASLKQGDTVPVKFISEVNAVCQNKGCWMRMNMGEEEAMVKFKDYGFFMPMDIAGQEVIVEGVAFVEEVSVEEQRHYAEDGGKTPEEIAAITEPKRTLSFISSGVLIPETEAIEKQ